MDSGDRQRGPVVPSNLTGRRSTEAPPRRTQPRSREQAITSIPEISDRWAAILFGRPLNALAGLVKARGVRNAASDDVANQVDCRRLSDAIRRRWLRRPPVA